MPCFSPLQANFGLRSDGKKELCFSNSLGRLFERGVKSVGDSLTLPCGSCIGCRLERSRQTALRCVHESRMHEHSCFVTLTYDDDHLHKLCRKTDAGYSLERSHVQKFIKRLRFAVSRGLFSSSVSKVVVFGSGEYGDSNGRPHFHLILFGVNFFDRVVCGVRDGFRYYRSKLLESLWSFGFSCVCDFSFEAAAYVARYCLKKVKGKDALDYYKGRTPEFGIFPSRPALGKSWYQAFGCRDLENHDSCIARGHECKPPRYYDKLRERDNPDGLAAAKRIRLERSVVQASDNTFERLNTKRICVESKIKSLVRKL